MKKKRYNKKTFNGPIFKLRTRNFKFDEDKAINETEQMKNKRREIGVPGGRPVRRVFYPRNRNTRRKKPTVDNKYLKDSLTSNPHYMMDDSRTKLTFDEAVHHEQSRSSSKDSNLSYRLMESSKDFFERNDLQNSKTLHNYDCWDNDYTPEEWVEKCQAEPERSHARCPFYRDKKYIWLPVKVLEFNHEKQRFLVKEVEGKTQKWVERLSLLFDNEDKNLFKQRVQLCKYYQRRAEDEMRFQNYAEKVEEDNIRPLSEDWVENIRYKSWVSKKNYRDDELLWASQLSSKIMETVKAEYNREMKKCFVVSEMKDKKNHLNFKNLKIKLRKYSKRVPFYGTIKKLEYDKSYRQLGDILAMNHSTRIPKIVTALKNFSLKNNQYVRKELLEYSFNINFYPSKLKNFMKIQKDSHNKQRNSLQIQWREYIGNDISEYLKDLKDFDPKIGKIDEYNSPSKEKLRRFLKRVDIIFRENVKSFTEHNIKCWLHYLRQFVMPTEDDKQVWEIQKKPMISLKILSRDRERDKKEKKGDKEKKKKDLIYFEPNEQTVIKQMKEPLYWIMETINGYKNLEPEIVSVLKLPSKPAFGVNEEMSMFKEAFLEIDSLMERAFRKPNEILERFQKYSFLFYKSPEDIVKSYWGKDRRSKSSKNTERKSVEDLDEYLHKVNMSIKEIEGLCINERNCHFFQIRSKLVKEAMIKRAEGIMKALLNKINQHTKSMVKEIQGKYDKLKVKMTETPKNEEELVVMQKALEGYEEELEKLDKEVDEAEAYIDLLPKYNFRYGRDDVIRFWFLKVMPTEIKAASSRGTKTALNRERHFMNNLDLEKSQFGITLEKLEREFEELRRTKNYELWKKREDKSFEIDRRITNALNTKADFNRREELFGIDKSKYESLEELKEKSEPYSQLRKISYEYMGSKLRWETGILMKIKYPEVENNIEKWTKDLNGLKRRFEASEDAEEALEICRALREDIDIFKQQTPVIRELTREAIVKNGVYWTEIFKCLGKQKPPQAQTTLNTLLSKTNIMEKIDQVTDICIRADKQYNLRIKFNDVILKALNECRLEIIPHKNTGTHILGDTAPLQQLFDDQFNSIVMMKQNPFVKPFKSEVDQIEKKLLGYQDMFDSWIKCQRGWIYLEPIFSSDEMRKELPKEKEYFEIVDKKWREVMSLIEEDPLIFQYQDWERIAKILDRNNGYLDEINKELNTYLEGKRSIFPRFYFLGDEELLEILSKAKDPTLIKKYMNKCFEGIQTITFNDSLEVLSMTSPKKEVIQFLKPIITNEYDKKGKVEIWLGDLEMMMIDTLIKLSIDASEDLETPRTEWVRKWPAQIVLAINNIKWTDGVEHAIETNTLDRFMNTLIDERNDIVDLVTGELTPLEKINLSALLTIDQHAIYVVEMLINEKISTVEDFDWISQLRYYFVQKSKREPLKIETKMLTSTLPYQYEYIGNTGRLVITQLTDRCYRTLMGAYESNYGGAPEGPAGTGKTETVKDLAKAIAVPCVVNNCSDQVNYVAMSKFFKGLSQCGAWCSLDEFNRIKPEVLSVVAEQIRTIQIAIRAKKKRFTFEGKECRLKESAFTCITMNPGYAGRAELPDNLKALFRPCAMMVPDYSLIAEIVLFSFGFREAQSLSTKLVASLMLSSEQLSGEKHYDFGMRALKAILVAAGNLKKENQKEDESRICLRALFDVNLPKFTQNDIPLFLSITSDLFPEVKKLETDYTMLIDKVKEICQKTEIEARDEFVTKCQQLYETILVRHGLMLVGDTMSAKSSAINTLRLSLEELDGQREFVKAVTFPLNPKAITLGQLYGILNPDTKLWTDGVLPQIMRYCENQAEVRERKWIVFDGPVDAIWIESMNTALDDNRILCLTNGQKIRVTEYMNLMFEVENLTWASPATVSRCAMVFFEPKQLGWEALVKAYINFKLKPVIKEMADFIWKRLDWFLTPSLAYAQKYGKMPFKIDEMQMTDAVIKIFDACVNWIGDRPEPLTGKEGEAMVNNFSLFSVFWGIGGVLEESSRKDFHNFMMDMIYYKDVCEMHKLFHGRQWTKNSIAYNFGGEIESIYDLVFDKQSFGWMSWIKTVQKWIPPKGGDITYGDIIIPTSDSIRNEFFMDLMLENGNHVLLVGPTGTAKTVGALNLITRSYSDNKTGNIQTVFSGQTSANQVQKMIESKMTSRRGGKGHWGPEENKSKMIVFIDDINMPQKEEYKAQPPIELLRMWKDYKYWYDLEEREKKYLHDMYFVATMGPPASGRNMITRRLLRHYFLIYTEPFSQQSLELIFNSILDWYFLNIVGQVQSSIIGLKEQIVKSTIRVYNEVTSNLLPTPSKSHYLYNLRDISRVFQGITKATVRSFSQPNDFIKLWAHECTRVFMDRLTNSEDIGLFMETILKTVMSEDLNREWSRLVKVEPLLWANFIPTIYPGGNKEKKPISGIYCELTDRENLQKYSDEFLEKYNGDTSEKRGDKLNLVLFTTAIEHLVRVVRIISTPKGHAFLVGVGGSGKRSLAKLSTFICGFNLFQIKLDEKYAYDKAWMEDLIEMFKECGGKNYSTVFLFSDTQIFNEAVLEDISSILNQGERPNLFPIEEKAQIIDELSDNYPNEVEGMNNNQRFEFFLKRCRENIHIALSFSPVGETFSKRLRTFPSLINCTTIDWFLPWPKTALESVAENLLEDAGLNTRLVLKISKIFVGMQERITKLSIRFKEEYKKYFYVTPKTYLELIDCFKRSIKTNTEKNQKNIDRYENGLKKLIDTEEEVDTKKKELEILRPQLDIAKKETKLLIAQVEKEQVVADEKKGECEIEEEKCNEERDKANILKDDCKQEVEKLEPILLEALKNLDGVGRDDIDFIKKTQRPTNASLLLFKALCILYGLKEGKKVKMKKDPDNQFKKIPDYFEACRKHVMKNPNAMLKNLKSYKEEKINAMNPTVIKKLQNMIEQEENFTEESLNRTSVAAGKIYNWMICILEVYTKLLLINPKREELAKAEAILSSAEEKLQISKDKLKAIIDKIEELNRQLEDAKAKETQLNNDVKRCERQVAAAKELIDGLKSKKISWDKKSKLAKEATITILGDTILSAGIIAYLGAFPKVYREEVTEEWESIITKNDIPVDQEFSLRKVCSDDLQIGNWVDKFSLPNDEISIQNAIIFQESSRFPLIIDPQVQANRWLKKLYKSKNIKILKPTDEPNKLTTIITGSIQQGFPVLIENAGEKLGSMFESILEKNMKYEGGINFMKFMQKFYSYDENFKFFITTKLPNPHYPPEICAQVTLLNFQVTPEGLQDQLVNLIVSKEHSTMASQWQKSVKEFYEFKNKTIKSENTILDLLRNQEGNILDDVELIDNLNISNNESKKADKGLAEIAKNRKKIEGISNNYKDCGFRVSNLFFSVTDMATVDPMYQFSLDWFLGLFVKAIAADPKNKATRSQDIVKTFTNMLFSKISRSLFKKDKLLFSFLIYLKVLHCDGTVTQEEIRKLLIVNIVTEKAKKSNPCSEWLSDKQWDQIADLVKFSGCFEGLDSDLKKNSENWKLIYEAVDPQDLPFPGDWDEKLTPVQKIMLMRVLRPEKLIPFIQKFIGEKLGKNFVEWETSGFGSILSETNTKTPIIFILSEGSDPLDPINKRASELAQEVRILSLGQGQDAAADAAIKAAKSSGNWIVLQNCHLAPGYLTKIEKELVDGENDKKDTPSTGYRLILTSASSDRFPVTILQLGIKVIDEAPRGIKANMTKTYMSIDKGVFDAVEENTAAWKKLVYGLSFFHALIQERKKFGSLGWNIPYGFSRMDMDISLDQIRIFLANSHDDVPWKALNYMIAEANYGGRVTDPMDRRLLKIILLNFFTDEILESGYKFSESGTYYAPREGEIEEYIDFIKDKMPLNDKPEVFGLHENASITSGMKDSDLLMNAVLGLQTQISGEGGQSPDEIITELSKKILAELPKKFDVDAVAAVYPLKYKESMNTVLQQELMKFNKLQEKIKTSLEQLVKAIAGTVMMNSELDEIYNKLFYYQVPDSWHKVSYPSLKPLNSWIEDFHKRIKFFQNWIDNGKPSAYWIPGFFFTQSFLTGTLQDYARTESKEIDTIVFDFEIIDGDSADQIVETPPDNGNYVYGLFIQGANWSEHRHCLTESMPKVLFNTMPYIWLKPKQSDPNERIDFRKKTYSCPVYKTSERSGELTTTGLSSNFVLSVDLPIDATNHKENSDHWVKRGVAMLCQLDD